MKKINILILGYSSLARRRLIPSLKKIKYIDYSICSKSFKTDKKKKILYNDYYEALKQTDAKIIYISTVNSLHFELAKYALTKGFHVIVDKPICSDSYKIKILLNIAKKNKTLLSEAIFFSYHKVFAQMKKFCEKESINHIQANFNIPMNKSLKVISKTHSDCLKDMGPYACSIMTEFANGKILDIKIVKKYFDKTKIIKSFFLIIKNKKTIFFGNFSFDQNYLSNLSFITKNKSISIPNRAFALPPNKNIKIITKDKNIVSFKLIKKDDCIANYIKEIISFIKSNKFDKCYQSILQNSLIMKKLSK